jgi:hypothetical protein
VKEGGGMAVPFLPLICSENAFATSVAVVSSPNSGKEVIVTQNSTYNGFEFNTRFQEKINKKVTASQSLAGSSVAAVRAPHAATPHLNVGVKLCLTIGDHGAMLPKAL